MTTDIKERAKIVICNALESNDSNTLDDQVGFKDLPDLEVDSIRGKIGKSLVLTCV